MDQMTDLQQAVLTFTVMDGGTPPKATDDHEDPVVTSSDESVGTATAVKTANVGEYTLTVVSGVAAPVDPATSLPTVESVAISVDGIVGPGANLLTARYEFTVVKDARSGASSLSLSQAVIGDKPAAVPVP